MSLITLGFWGCAKREAIQPLRIAYNTWVGFGPLFLAQEKGFFEKEGIKVELKLMEGTGVKGSTLTAGDIDGIATTADAFVVQSSQGVPGVIVMGFDESLGADGVVATTNIKSMIDMKGKKVGVQPGFVGHFFLLYLLDEAGLEPSDIQIEPLETGNAGAAFVAGKIDVAVTWEPWLSKAKERHDGYVLITSKEKPGLIVDVLVVSEQVLRKRRDDVQKLMRGWHAAVDYWKKYPDESTKIIADSFGLDVGETAEMLSGLRFFDYARNLQYFGTQENPGQIYQVVNKASEVWLKQKLIKYPVEAKKIIDSSLLRALEDFELDEDVGE